MDCGKDDDLRLGNKKKERKREFSWIEGNGVSLLRDVNQPQSPVSLVVTRCVTCISEILIGNVGFFIGELDLDSRLSMRILRGISGIIFAYVSVRGVSVILAESDSVPISTDALPDYPEFNIARVITRKYTITRYYRPAEPARASKRREVYIYRDTYTCIFLSAHSRLVFNASFSSYFPRSIKTRVLYRDKNAQAINGVMAVRGKKRTRDGREGE